LDRPLWEQYTAYLGNLAHFDLNYSMSSYPSRVADQIGGPSQVRIFDTAGKAQGTVPILPVAAVNGVQLYYEEAGSGTPIIFSHEFAGSCESWEPQLRYFGRRHRCISYAARGWPPR